MPHTKSRNDACPLCEGALTLVSEDRAVAVGRRSAVVRDEFYRCDSCGEELYAPGQMNASMRRASDRIREAEGLLLPDEIRTIREDLVLSQQAFETLLGVGVKTVVRWEKGTVFQNKATDSLIRVLAAFPSAAAFLAQRHGVKLSSGLA